MGKETDTPQGDASKEKNPPQTNLPRRSPRSERFKGEEVAAATPTPGPSSTTTTTTTTTEKRRLIATVTKNNSSSSGKCPSSSGRKLSALSAHKRALETPENGKGMERSSSKRQLNNNSTPQPANTPIEKAQTTEDSTPMRTGAPPMTVAEVRRRLYIFFSRRWAFVLIIHSLIFYFFRRPRKWESKPAYEMMLCGP